MLLIPCPYCGNRPEVEFHYAGKAHIVRPAEAAVTSAVEWAEYVYFRSNCKGVHAERWHHLNGCGRFFNALRDTVSDRFLASYDIGAARPERGPGA